jgi:hypothetical protein
VESSTGAVEMSTDQIRDVVRLDGRGRLPADLSAELMDVLGDVCRVVVCDLSGMAAAGMASLVEAFTPASHYLRQWRGTILVVHAPEPVVRPALSSALLGDQIIVADSLDAAQQRAQKMVPTMRSVGLLLPPWPQSPGQARAGVRNTLRDWGRDEMADVSQLVVTELVTNAVVHARTPLQLSLTQAGAQLRIAVRDRGGGRAGDGDIPYASSLHGRGLLLVKAYARGWGVLPARRAGKTVWAVLETTHEHC